MTDTHPDARHTASEARDDASQAAHRVADDARNLAHETTQRARDEAYRQGDRAKSGVASEMSGIADALRKAAEEMRSGSPQERTIAQLAGGLADASEAVRDRDLGELAAELSGFARRNPVAFLGGAALAGFAATRFAKASASAPRGSRDIDYGAPEAPRSTAGAAPGIATPPDRGDIPAPATQPATTSPGTGSTTAPASPTSPYTTGER